MLVAYELLWFDLNVSKNTNQYLSKLIKHKIEYLGTISTYWLSSKLSN